MNCVILNVSERFVALWVLTFWSYKRDRRKSASYYAQVSRAIAELKSQKLIKCLNPKEKTGRLYRLTKKGSAILKKLS
jgi:hypothetical protein